MSLPGFFDLIGLSHYTTSPGMLLAGTAYRRLSVLLAAVIGSEKLHDLGYAYGYEPILLNAVTLLLIAIAFNGLFRWRRYPAHLHVTEEATESKVPGYEPIKHEDFVYALSHIDTFVDITEEDLLKIYELATQRQVRN